MAGYRRKFVVRFDAIVHKLRFRQPDPAPRKQRNAKYAPATR